MAKKRSDGRYQISKMINGKRKYFYGTTKKAAIEAMEIIEEINASKQTVFTLLNKIVEQNILISSDKAKNRTFICPKLLSIIDS